MIHPLKTSLTQTIYVYLPQRWVIEEIQYLYLLLSTHSYTFMEAVKFMKTNVIVCESIICKIFILKSLFLFNILFFSNVNLVFF